MLIRRDLGLLPDLIFLQTQYLFVPKRLRHLNFSNLQRILLRRFHVHVRWRFVVFLAIWAWPDLFFSRGGKIPLRTHRTSKLFWGCGSRRLVGRPDHTRQKPLILMVSFPEPFSTSTSGWAVSCCVYLYLLSLSFSSLHLTIIICFIYFPTCLQWHSLSNMVSIKLSFVNFFPVFPSSLLRQTL